MKTTLYKLNNTNSISWWEIHHDENSSLYYIYWGQDLNNRPANHKNCNEYKALSPEKAKQEVQSRINKMLDRKGYSREIPKSQPDKPMLAQKFGEHYPKLLNGVRDDYQIAIQPKLDGIRCLATPTQMLSREFGVIGSCPHIEYILSGAGIEIDFKLDGELYIHNTDLQTISSIVRKQRPSKLSKIVEYHVFDLVDTESPFVARMEQLLRIMRHIEDVFNQYLKMHLDVPAKLRTNQYISETCPIKLVPTTLTEHNLSSPEAKALIEQHFKTFREQKYEGCMIRNMQSLYQLDYRSPDLLKYKEVEDHEFEIIDVVEAYGGMGTFVCKTRDDKIFEATPSWTRERKRWLLRCKEKFIGRWLTVEYEKLSRDGIPLKPTGKLTHDAPRSEATAD